MKETHKFYFVLVIILFAGLLPLLFFGQASYDQITLEKFCKGKGFDTATYNEKGERCCILEIIDKNKWGGTRYKIVPFSDL